MNKIIAFGYAPTYRDHLQKLLKKCKEGVNIINDDWMTTDRKRVFPPVAINLFAHKMTLGEANRNKNIKQTIDLYQQKRIKEAGVVLLTAKDNYLRSTIKNYACKIANQMRVSLYQKAIKKSQSLNISENSIRCVVANLSTHIFRLTRRV